MSVVCAVNVGGKTHIGSDTQATVGHRYALMNCEKIIACRNWAFGSVGYARTMQVVSDNRDAIFYHDHPSAVVNAVRAALAEDGYSTDHEEHPVTMGGQYVLTNGPNLWMVGGDFSIVPVTEGEMVAIGSGGEYALGADFGYCFGKKRLPSPRRRVEVAVASAITNDLMCGGTAIVWEIRS